MHGELVKLNIMNQTLEGFQVGLLDLQTTFYQLTEDQQAHAIFDRLPWATNYGLVADQNCLNLKNMSMSSTNLTVRGHLKLGQVRPEYELVIDSEIFEFLK